MGISIIDDMKELSVEKALDLLELAMVYSHGCIYDDVYDFAKTLVVRCDVDPDYVFQELGNIVSCVYDGDYSKKVLEINANVRPLTSEEKRSFLVNLQKLKEQIIKEEEKRCEILSAKERYKKLVGLSKLIYRLKDGKPSNDNFDAKTTQDIKNMYVKKRKK